jgi:alpha-L-fucosidase 2
MHVMAAVTLVPLLLFAVGAAPPDGRGLTLSADSDIYEAPLDPALDLTDAVSLEAWVRAEPMPDSGGRILDRMPPGGLAGYLLDTWPGNSLRLITSNGQCRYDAKLTSDHWTHVVGVYSSSARTMCLYVDGREVAAVTEGEFPPLAPFAGPLRVGADQTGGNRFVGAVLRAAVYGRALGPDEVARRAGGDLSPLPGAIGEWDLSAAGGRWVQPAAGTVALRRPVRVEGERLPPSEPLSLWYRKPAERWTEGVLLGNGRLGGIVYGGVPDETVALNEDTLWSGEPRSVRNPEALGALPEIRRLLFGGKNAEAHSLVQRTFHGVYNQCYLPLGEMRLSFPEPDAVQAYRRDLDLAAGVAHVRYRVGETTFTREAFASAPDQAIVMRLGCDRPGGLDVAIGLASQLRSTVTPEGDDVVLSGRCPIQADPSYAGSRVLYEDGKGMRFEARLRVLHEGGTLTAEGDRLRLRGADAATLILVAATSYNGYDRDPETQGRDEASACRQTLDDAAARPYDDLLARHVADHRALFRRVGLELAGPDRSTVPTDERIRSYQPGADPGLAALHFQFGRYMVIAGSRLGTQPLNLQGIWNADLNPAWSANWTLNCNAEINYWGAEVAALPECHLPLADLVAEMAVDGRKVAAEMYGAGGWVAHHNTDVWRSAAPVDGDPIWFIFQTGGAWLCQHLWEHYRFTGDEAFLQRVWPLLEGATRFYLDSLVEEPVHGWLVDAPATNFENAGRKPDGEVAAVCVGPTADMQIIRELLQNTREASAILGQGAGLRTEIDATLPRLAPMQVSPTTGWLQEWIDDWQPLADGQMLSLWGLICGTQISTHTTPALADAVRKALAERRIVEAYGGGCHSWIGAFPANAYARLGEGDKSLDCLDRHLARSLNPNMTAHMGGMAQFEIDGNLGMMSAVAEMLLQSHERTPTGQPILDLLPALPSAWPTGTVRGLRARGGFAVDLTWRDGRLLEATVRSARGGSCAVRYGPHTEDLAVASEVVWQPPDR